VRPPALVRLGIPAAAGAAAFLFFFRPITDDDVWLHFAAGRWILDHARIPDVDEFSCTAAGAAYVDHEWLAQAAFELVRRAFGVGGFRAFLALAPAVAYALFARTALRLRARPVAVLAAVALSLALQWHLARLRPHLWTLLFTAILTDGYLARPRPPGVKGWIGFAALILTWGNSHAAAVIAPALLGAGCAGAWLARDAVRAKGLALLTAGAAALLIDYPYGGGVYR
jgi:hypothetical protein